MPEGKRKVKPRSYARYEAYLRGKGELHDVEHFKFPNGVPGQWTHVGVVVLKDGSVYACRALEVRRWSKVDRVQSKARGVKLVVEDDRVWIRAYNRKWMHQAAVGRAMKAAWKDVFGGVKLALRDCTTVMDLPLLEKRALREACLDLMVSKGKIPVDYKENVIMAKRVKRMEVHHA